jgi:hypothetical protein
MAEREPVDMDAATVGLIALIDEATGYQQVRPAGELAREFQKLRRKSRPGAAREQEDANG